MERLKKWEYEQKFVIVSRGINMLYPRMATREEYLLLLEAVPSLKSGSVISAYDHHYNLNQDKYSLPIFDIETIQGKMFYAKSKSSGKIEKMKNWMLQKPRAYTVDEIREQFIKHVWGLINYWEHESRAETVRDKMSGLAHSLFATLDGCSLGLPGFIMSPTAHPSDKEYHRSRGENFYPSDVDIGGVLHEILHRYEPKGKNELETRTEECGS